MGIAHRVEPDTGGRSPPYKAVREVGMRPRTLRDGLLTMLLVVAMPCWADGPPTYERDIRPLLARRCTVCHNAKKLADPDISAGLALDTFEAALAGTKDHRVVVAGKAA